MVVTNMINNKLVVENTGKVLMVLFGVVMAMFVFSGIIIDSAFGQLIDDEIVVTTDKVSYSEGETIVITGEVRDLYSGTPVSVIVESPDGRIISITQVGVDVDKKFNSSLTAGGSLMYDIGIYTVTAQYGTVNRLATATFEYLGNMPPQFPLILNSNHNNTLSQQIVKWNDQLNQTTHSIDENMILYYIAINNNSTIQIDIYTRIIGDLMALQNVYEILINDLVRMLNSYT